MSNDHLPTVDHVDLARYAGDWFEIARKPFRFEDDGSRDVTATYTPDGDEVAVSNRCINADGEFEEATARATPQDDSGAKLSVNFLPTLLRWIPFTDGDYWILRLDPGYRMSLVGTPDRKYLWLLSRDHAPSEDEVQDYLRTARELGFDTDDVIRPAQSGTVHTPEAHGEG